MPIFPNPPALTVESLRFVVDTDDPGASTAVSMTATTLGAAQIPETVTSGALALSPIYSNLSVTGTVAYTLGDGEYVGQRKVVECTVAASTPVGTLTINDVFGSESTVHVFTAVGQKLDLVWTATGWRMVGKVRAGVQITTVGTTVLTGYDMNANLSCSVTGTVVSATTKGVPNGTVPGEVLIVSCSTAASTPVGSITGTYLTLANTAATDLQAIGATTDTVSLLWTGAAWLVIANSGITVA